MYSVHMVNRQNTVKLADEYTSLPVAIRHADHIQNTMGLHVEVWWHGSLQYSTDPQNVEYLEIERS